jgi:hypothetical protein
MIEGASEARMTDAVMMSTMTVAVKPIEAMTMEFNKDGGNEEFRSNFHFSYVHE